MDHLKRIGKDRVVPIETGLCEPFGKGIEESLISLEDILTKVLEDDVSRDPVYLAQHPVFSQIPGMLDLCCSNLKQVETFIRKAKECLPVEDTSIYADSTEERIMNAWVGTSRTVTPGESLLFTLSRVYAYFTYFLTSHVHLSLKDIYLPLMYTCLSRIYTYLSCILVSQGYIFTSHVYLSLKDIYLPLMYTCLSRIYIYLSCIHIYHVYRLPLQTFLCISQVSNT